MKALSVLLLLTLGASGRAAAPPSFTGFYRENLITAGGTLLYHQFIEFRADGTWELLSASQSARPSFIPSNYGRARVGFYRYEILDASGRARITLVEPGDDGNSPVGPQTLNVVFADEESGSRLISVGGGSFRLSSTLAAAPMVNQSSRATVTPNQPLRSGFVLQRDSIVLIRAVGPSLRQFGVADAAANPRLNMQLSPSQMLDNDDWEEGPGSVSRVSQLVGAFPLASGSKDAAMVVQLKAGAHVATASVGASDAGNVLLEIYFFDAL